MGEPAGRPFITAERWELVEPWLDRALELRAEQATEYLKKECPDPEIRLEVERLLEECRRAELYLENASPAPWEDLPEAETIDRYRLLRRVGSGGMGDVYLGEDPALGRQVAIKVLRPSLMQDREARELLRTEARAASGTDHPNVAVVHDISQTEDDRLYLVMGYCPGGTLRERMAEGPVPESEALAIGAQIARGLQAAHEREVVHRDIKPSNIAFAADGTVKILDFGIAQTGTRDLTEQGTALGTAAYMSPEQTRGEQVDIRTDIWSLGVVLYEMLSGRHPFPGNTRQRIDAIRDDEPPALDTIDCDCSSSAARIVARCMEKDRKSRYSSASAVVDDLLAAAEAGRPEPRVDSGRRLAEPRTVALLAAVAVAALGWFWIPRGETNSSAALKTFQPLAVLPFRAANPDTALERLSRELVIALSINLDGVGEITVADPSTILAHASAENGAPGSLEASLAPLAIGSFVTGSMVRAGRQVQISADLRRAADGTTLARASSVSHVDSVAVIADSLAVSILHQVIAEEAEGAGPVPSLAAAASASLPALRDYLAAEEAFARGDYPAAVRGFKRAFEEDSTFWFAYWRSLYPRVGEGTDLPESGAYDSVWAHRHEFPDVDRLHVEVGRLDSLSDRLSAFESIMTRYPTHWGVRYAYANLLVHWAPYLGTTMTDARVALERVVELNPRHIPAWRHLRWTHEYLRDTTAHTAVWNRLLEMTGGSPPRGSPPADAMSAIEEALRTGDLSPRSAEEFARSSLEHLGKGPVTPEIVAQAMRDDGFPRAQITLSKAVLAENLTPRVRNAQTWGIALAWATRGSWDSAGTLGLRWARATGEAEDALRAYGLAVSGASIGGLEPAAPESIRRLVVQGMDPSNLEQASELAWLDGILSFARGDAAGLSAARSRLDVGACRHADILGRSLASFARALSGDSLTAGDELARHERALAQLRLQRSYGPEHPYFSSVNRVAAARWLLTAGDMARADRLLSWHESVLWGLYTGLESGNRVFSGPAYLERARIARSTGRSEEARFYYSQFLALYDAPVQEHAAWLEEATGALAELTAAAGE